MQSNNEMIQKTLQLTDFANGGQLNPVQQTKFVELVQDFGVMTKMVRVETLTQARMDIDRMHVGEPITEAADEESDGGVSSTQRKPVFDKVQMNVSKLRSGWNITTEALQNNITKEQLEDRVMDIFTRRFATDLELLAIQGDVSTYTGDTTGIGKLLVRDNGWDVLTQGAHIVDCGGANVQKEIFAEMIRAMPEQFLNDPDLRFFTSKKVSIDWMDEVSNRQTVGGDQALGGNVVKPYGIPIVEVPWIPNNKSITVDGATSGFVTTSNFGPFTIVAGSNDLLKVNVDAAGAAEITIPPGVYQTAALCNTINGLLGVRIARDDTFGRVIFVSPTSGAGSIIDFDATSTAGHNVCTTLGYSATAINTGTASGSTGSVKEGSFIWLANPKNFILGLLAGTRIHAWFNHDKDRIEVRMYNQVDFQIENLDGIVKATNVRAKRA